MEYTFTWLIENYSYYWPENEVLSSPEFITNDLEGSNWCLLLHPSGMSDKCKHTLSIFLSRRDGGSNPIPLKYELSVLDANGETLKSIKCEHTFKDEVRYGSSAFLNMKQILKNLKTTYFPEDNLRLRCKMRKDGDSVISVTQISARTRFGIQQIAFLHEVEGFSLLEPNQKKTIEILVSTGEAFDLSCSLYVTDGPCCQGKVLIEILPSERGAILSQCKVSLLDGSRRSLHYSLVDSRFNARKRDIEIFPLPLTRQEILNRNDKYLPDDKLSLWFECTFYNGIDYEKIEKTVYEKFSAALNQLKDNDQGKVTCAEKMSHSNSALNDFKKIYNDEFLTDMTIETKTKSFPVHKIILCARSLVFKAMMVSDMKETNTNIIQVDDIEDDIVQKFLLFLYSDNIEALQWETAKKLYYAADKYAVEKLKVLCSSFLVDNLSAASASKLLLFADTHNDSRLKKSVEDYIFKHERSVYGSDEWKNLLGIEPQLVGKTMLLMHEKKL